MEYLLSDFVDFEKTYVDDIPLYVLTPKNEDKAKKTVIFYHGWSSSAKNQLFRANILASYGYRVVLPEAQFHGERGNLEYEEETVFKNYFPRVIMHNIEEFPKIYKFIVEKLGADEDNMAVGGHSMGAITAGGLYTFKQNLKVALLFNGTMDWAWLAESLVEGEKEVPYERLRMNDFLIQMNPLLQADDLVDRALVLLNGEEDDVMDPKSMEKFYDEISPKYKDKELIHFKKFEHTYHQLTTQMREEAIRFMKEKISF
ncbi:MAG: prolyl oligopeptidase family serine peptidase [Peptoniphilus sp.]|nr:prolyl oligopeptidase family serine peptidase [Peptoniphilus sp.]